MAILDPHVLFAECLQLALSFRGHEAVLIPVQRGLQTLTPLLTAVLRQRPAVVSLALDLGGGKDGTALIEPIAASGIAVVVVTGESDRSRWGECLVQGARTVVSKEDNLSAVTAAITRIEDGVAAMPREDFQRLVRHYYESGLERRAMMALLERLTARESEVLHQLMAGHSVSDIARVGVVSQATVRTQVKSVLSKLEVSSQLAAVAFARQAQQRDAGEPSGIPGPASGEAAS